MNHFAIYRAGVPTAVFNWHTVPRVGDVMVVDGEALRVVEVEWHCLTLPPNHDRTPSVRVHLREDRRGGRRRGHA